jgi:hypothetical protein
MGMQWRHESLQNNNDREKMGIKKKQYKKINEIKWPGLRWYH